MIAELVFNRMRRITYCFKQRLQGFRYWPAVLAWWNRRYGLSILNVSQPDGKDDLDALG